MLQLIPWRNVHVAADTSEKLYCTLQLIPLRNYTLQLIPLRNYTIQLIPLRNYSNTLQLKLKGICILMLTPTTH